MDAVLALPSASWPQKVHAHSHGLYQFALYYVGLHLSSPHVPFAGLSSKYYRVLLTRHPVWVPEPVLVKITFVSLTGKHQISVVNAGEVYDSVPPCQQVAVPQGQVRTPHSIHLWLLYFNTQFPRSQLRKEPGDWHTGGCWGLILARSMTQGVLPCLIAKDAGKCRLVAQEKEEQIGEGCGHSCGYHLCSQPPQCTPVFSGTHSCMYMCTGSSEASRHTSELEVCSRANISSGSLTRTLVYQIHQGSCTHTQGTVTQRVHTLKM